MSNDRFASAHEMVREYQELELKMADPSIHEDQGKARQLGRRYARERVTAARGRNDELQARDGDADSNCELRQLRFVGIAFNFVV